MFKKRKTILFVIIIVGMIYSASRGVEYVSMPGRAIKKINEDYYNIKINVNEKKVMVDGNEMELSDFLGVSDKKVDGMIEENSINEYLENNLIGNMKISDDGISIFNPFSTDGLFVVVKENCGEEVVEDYDTIIEHDEIIKDRYTLSFENANDTKDAYNKLKNDSRVKSVFYNYKFYLRETNAHEFSTKNVAQEYKAWGVDSTGLGNYSKKMNSAKNKNDVKIAVLDSGILGTHEVFDVGGTLNRIDYTLAYDYTDKDDDVADDMGHGTMVGGIIAESTSNNVSIIPMKVFKEDGSGEFDDIIKALDVCVDNVDIVNMSLGVNINDAESSDDFYNFCDESNPIFKEYYDQGLIMVCAAGNDGNQLDFPGCSPYTLTASAIDSNNEIAYFSCFGDEVDFALPGSAVEVPINTSDSAYALGNGTSLSTPFLSSAIAEILSEKGTDIAREEWMNILKQNAVDLGDEGKDIYYGYGSLDFNSYMFNKPDIISLDVPENVWNTSIMVSANAICGNSITSYALTQSDTEPSQWQNVSSPSTDVDISLDVRNNGTNYIWVKDSLGNVTHKSFEVRYVDSIAPTIGTLSCVEKSRNGFTATIDIQDGLSGVSKVEWYFKDSSSADYTKYTEILEDEGIGRTDSFEGHRVFSDLNSDTEYELFVDVFDMAGNYSRSNELRIRTDKEEKNITVKNYTNKKASITIGEETSDENHTFISAENNIRVTCEEACVVLIRKSENEYETISGSGSGKIYDFNLGNNIENDIEVEIALRGDTNLSGSVNLTDAIEIRRSRLSLTHELYAKLSALEEKVADANKSGSLNLTDAITIRKSRLSPSSGDYKKLEW